MQMGLAVGEICKLLIHIDYELNVVIGTAYAIKTIVPVRRVLHLIPE